jgi:uncharacterized membrane protein
MSVFSGLYTLHLLLALIWVGGMFFAWMIVRPVAAQLLEPAQRLPLWSALFKRFFHWVGMAVILLPISGIGMLHAMGSGWANLPRHVQIMIGLYLVMVALFLRLRLLLWPALRDLVQAQDWPAAGAQLARIRRVVGLNLLVGLVLIAVAALRLH